MFDKKISELIANFVQRTAAMPPIEREEWNVGFQVYGHCQSQVHKRHFEIVCDGSSSEFNLIDHQSINFCVTHRAWRVVQRHHSAGEYSFRRVTDGCESAKSAELLVELAQGPGREFLPAYLDEVEPGPPDGRFK